MGQGKARAFGPLVAQSKVKTAPFLKWAGGKGQLLEQMEKWIPSDYNSYLEPFLGGGALFFHLLPETAILGDVSEELINAYTIVKEDSDALMRALDDHSEGKTDPDYYYDVRRLKPRDLDSVARAARTVFLNKTCYNGLYRVNSRGEFNVPFGRYKNPKLYDPANLRACRAALRGVRLLTGDFHETLEHAGEADFVYLDPPYQPLSATASFTSYTKDSFSENDQRDLAQAFSRLDAKGCKVMLSNSATPLVKELYGEHEIHTIRASRPISSKAETRGAIEEFLVTNYTST